MSADDQMEDNTIPDCAGDSNASPDKEVDNNLAAAVNSEAADATANSPPKNAVDISVVASLPPAAVESPLAAVESPPAAVESPPAAVESPPAAVESPPAAVESPPAAVELQEEQNDTEEPSRIEDGEASNVQQRPADAPLVLDKKYLNQTQGKIEVADNMQEEPDAVHEAKEVENSNNEQNMVEVGGDTQAEMEADEQEQIEGSGPDTEVAEEADGSKIDSVDPMEVTETPPADAEDMEDGELSDEDEGGKDADISPTASSTDVGTVEATSSLTTNSSSTDQTTDVKARTVATKRSRKSTESSEEQHEKADSGSSSSSEEESKESKSERKRKKKEKERRKKEKKQKRKREKQERKMKRKRQKIHEYEGEGYQDYDGYGDRWRDNSGRSPPQRQKRGYGGGNGQYGEYTSYGGDARSPSTRGAMYNSPPDPYASPPDDSSEDEFSETLYSLVGDELMDPNVSAAEKEAMFKKQQERIPGLSAGKLKKIMKKRRFQEQQRQRQRDSQRRDRREGGHTRDKSQKCRYYAEGKCQKGERCQFSHNFIPAKKMEACKFFLQGYCAKGDMCIYLHSEVPCKYYHTGQKCFNAEKCKFSHEPLTDSTKPLLEKAILLEETGTFKSERPSLLGSPPKDSLTPSRNESSRNDNHRVKSFDPDDDEDMGRESHMNKSALLHPNIPSIFSLDIQPTRDMKDKLDSGLFEELTAPDSESDEERFDSPPHRPQSFYADTLSTPNRPDTGAYTSDDQVLSSPNRVKKNRWGPDLPNRQTNDRYGNHTNNAQDFKRGGGDADRGTTKKTPLLPIPSKPAPFSHTMPAAANQQAHSCTGDIDESTAQAAAANLNKILNALRSGAVQSTNNSRPVADPRATPVVPDPRAAVADPRAAVANSRALLADPRAAPAVADPRAAVTDPRAVVADPRAADPRMRVQDPRGAAPILPDPRGQSVVPAASPAHPGYDPHIDPRAAAHQPLIAPAHRPAPEINGRFVRPMEFRLIPVHVEVKTLYIPAGAEHSQEMLRDPRIKKRVLSMKQEGPPSLPSLPDITADLQRIQNAQRHVSNSVPVPPPSRQSSRTSIDSIADTRRNSLDGRQPSRGQGDQNSNTESVIENGTKARNSTRTSLSRVNPMTSGASYANPSTFDDDDEDEHNSLTIDMPEDDIKSASKPVETGCT